MKLVFDAFLQNIQNSTLKVMTGCCKVKKMSKFCSELSPFKMLFQWTNIIKLDASMLVKHKADVIKLDANMLVKHKADVIKLDASMLVKYKADVINTHKKIICSHHDITEKLPTYR
jgi:hypothetical protein